MNKPNFFVKFLKNIIKIIHNLLEKNLNKLKFENLVNLARSNKIFLTFVVLIIFSLSYLSIPNVYKQSEISKELKKQLSSKFDLDFYFSKNLKYSFFPRPHFTTVDSTILVNQNEISKIKDIKIYITLKNLFSLKNIDINEVIIEKANFNLNSQNYNFFTKILDNNFKGTNLKINDSNIFFRNIENEILFINKILNIKYYFDTNELKNIAYSENKLFNLPYTFKIFHNKDEKKFLSKLNLNFLKLQIQNELNYKDYPKKGLINIIFDKSKSNITYHVDNNNFKFNFFDKKKYSKFSYKGLVNFYPFYSSLRGFTDEINLSYFINPNNLIVQLLESEILNNDNLNFDLFIEANTIQDFPNFKNFFLNSKIEEGLIDIDDTSFEWKNFVDFKLFDTLVFVKDYELVLDGKLNLDIKNYKEVYKSLQTPKNLRNKIEKINLDYRYNFHKKVIHINNIRIDNKFNDNIKKISLKNFDLQNKIYIKNILNEAIKNYAG
tara:strand:+ start:374 stop:1852 length:1479 start_codon:yes stop_codon:yes gene_type:complete